VVSATLAVANLPFDTLVRVATGASGKGLAIPFAPQTVGQSTFNALVTRHARAIAQACVHPCSAFAKMLGVREGPCRSAAQGSRLESHGDWCSRGILHMTLSASRGVNAAGSPPQRITRDDSLVAFEAIGLRRLSILRQVSAMIETGVGVRRTAA
jgi:hypothetical protein